MPDQSHTKPAGARRRLVPFGLPVSAVLAAVIVILAKGYFSIPTGAPWDPSVDMPAALHELRAGDLGGRVFVTGVGPAWPGDSSAAPDTAWMAAPVSLTAVFDPETREWTRGTPMPVAVWAGASAVLGDRLFVIGGEIDDEVTEQVWFYTPESDAWQRAPDLPRPRTGAAACSVGGKLWVMGGWVQGDEDWERRPARSVVVYDPDSCRWSAGPEMTEGREGSAAASAGGRLYVFGGLDTSGVSTASVEVLDPDSGRWLPGPEMLTPRRNAAAATVGDLIFVIGGRTEREGAWDGVEILDTRTDAWQVGQSLRIGRRDHTAVAVGRTVYVLGGQTQTGWMLPDIVPTVTVEASVVRFPDD